jgi:hypothetical protein
MNKSIQVAILQLETETKVKALAYLMKLSEDFKPMLDTSHVIIGHFKDKKGFHFSEVHHFAPPLM